MLPIKTPVMTDLEREDFAVCDRALGNLFAECVKKYLEIGRIMRRILDLKLYRERYESFDAYIADRWALEPKTFRLWATYAEIADRIAEKADEAPLLFVSQLTNFNLSHAMVLNRLPHDMQAEAWSTANRVEESPTAKALEHVVDSFQEEIAAAGGVANMTKAEELDFLKRAEAASDAAVTMAKSIESAGVARKTLAKASRELSQTRYGETFKATLALIAKADAELEKHETAGEKLYQERESA